MESEAPHFLQLTKTGIQQGDARSQPHSAPCTRMDVLPGFCLLTSDTDGIGENYLDFCPEGWSPLA